MKDLERAVRGRLRHANQRASDFSDLRRIHKDNEQFMAGYDLGYWESRVSAYNIVLDMIDEIEEELSCSKKL